MNLNLGLGVVDQVGSSEFKLEFNLTLTKIGIYKLELQILKMEIGIN